MPLENDTRIFTIESYRRTDGIMCYYFKIDGETRKSSYDEKQIKAIALGYTGRDIEIVRVV